MIQPLCKLGAWLKTPVRYDRGKKEGVVVGEEQRSPTVKYLKIQDENGLTHELRLYSECRNQSDCLGFQWEYRPGQWAYISDNVDDFLLWR